VEVLLATFSPQYGIASLITITAKISSEVEVDYSVDHYQATEGSRLQQYYLVCAFGILFAVLILISKVWELLSSDDIRAKAVECVVDVLCQTVLPIIWFAMRMVQVGQSGYLVDHTVGHYGLAGIPWQEQDMLLEDKISQFLSLLHHFEDEIDLEKNMSYFYFAVAALLFFKLIMATEAHPRIAMLVQTIRIGLDDIIHFVLLFVLVTFGYMVLGMAQFGHFRSEFQDFDSAFRTLWDMQLGSMLGGGAIRSSQWSTDPLLWLYQMTYMVLNFFIMFNFVIAIIVEAYMQVKNEVMEDDTEQAIWTDTVCAMQYALLGQLKRYPQQAHIVGTLELCRKENIDYGIVRHLFPEWRDRRSIISWLEYYSQYDFLAPRYSAEKKEGTELESFQRWLHNEMSVMLGVPKPTEYERTLETKRLLLIGFRERVRRKKEEKEKERAQPRHVLPSTSSDAPSRKSSILEQMTGKEKRLMTLPMPPSQIVKDTFYTAGPQHASGRLLEKMPGWVEEEAGAQAAAKMAAAVKASRLRIDAPLLRFFDHDSWKQLGVDDALVRCRLLRRQLQETSSHAGLLSLGEEAGKGGGNNGAGHVVDGPTVVEDFVPPSMNMHEGSLQELDGLLEDIQAVSPAPGGGAGMMAGSGERFLPGQVGERPRSGQR